MKRRSCYLAVILFSALVIALATVGCKIAALSLDVKDAELGNTPGTIPAIVQGASGAPVGGLTNH